MNSDDRDTADALRQEQRVCRQVVATVLKSRIYYVYEKTYFTCVPKRADNDKRAISREKEQAVSLCFFCAYRNLGYISEVEEDSMMSNIPSLCMSQMKSIIKIHIIVEYSSLVPLSTLDNIL